jgi:hypothetical protein
MDFILYSKCKKGGNTVFTSGHYGKAKITIVKGFKAQAPPGFTPYHTKHVLSDLINLSFDYIGQFYDSVNVLRGQVVLYTFSWYFLQFIPIPSIISIYLYIKLFTVVRTTGACTIKTLQIRNVRIPK